MDKEMLEFYKNALRGDINATPLCAEYKSLWRKCGDDKESLVRFALMQQSIPYFVTASKNNLGLSKEYIMNTFGDYINGNRILCDVEGVEGYSYQLYVGFEGEIAVSTDVTSLMWCNTPTVEIEECKCPILYVSNSSDIRIICNGFNSINIKLFDDSKVTIYDMDETCNALIYKYSDDAEVEIGKYCLGKVKTFRKELKL